MSDRSLRSLLLAAAFVATAIATTAHAGFPPTRRCALLKLRISRELAQDLIDCQVAAADESGPASAKCISDAVGKFRNAWSDIVARRPCLDTAAASDVDGVVKSTVEGITADLRPSPLAPSACSEALLRLTRFFLTQLSTANVRNTRHPNQPRLEASVAAAYALLHEGFTQATALPGCPDTASEDAIRGPLDDLEGWWLATIFPQCGDGIVGGAEQCDGDDDAACPGLCSDTCSCDGTN